MLDVVLVGGRTLLRDHDSQGWIEVSCGKVQGWVTRADIPARVARRMRGTVKSSPNRRP